MKRFFHYAVFSAGVLTAFAAPADDARQLVKEGDFEGARKLLAQALSENAKLSQNAEYNYLLGACEFDSGNYDEASRLLRYAKEKGYGPANLYLGRLAFLDYDFDGAAGFYDDFRKHREKTGQVVGETVEELEHQLSIAENSLSRVEKIVVIDSLAVPSGNFFTSYRIPRSAGRLILPEEMPVEESRQGAVMAFMNEGGDFMMWGEPDSIGNVHLMESMRLTDGTWQTPEPVADHLGNNGYADYPFMMPDGVTLYYSSDGDGSMGGYDIFVASRDAATGEYLQPQNVGMPFNSPYDDLLLAIDEENGIGWWATDRNRLDGKITIYVYVVNELRKNYDADDENLLQMAMLGDYRATQNPGDEQKYRGLLATIADIDPKEEEREAEFNFPVGGGKYYHYLSDFRNPSAADAMNAYLRAGSKLGSLEKKLAALRRRYPASRADNLREEIMRMENEIEGKRKELIKLKSDVYRCERGAR